MPPLIEYQDAPLVMPPAAAAAAAAAGAAACFRLASVQPVDLFPHTDHVEVVAVLDNISVAAA